MLAGLFIFVQCMYDIDIMFTSAQLNGFKEIAKSIISTKITFNRQRLLIRTNFTTDEDYTAFFVFIFFAGVMLCLAFGLSIVLEEWALLGFSVFGFAGLIIGSRKLMYSRKFNSSRPPELVFDSDLQSLFILNRPQGLKQVSSYDRYFIGSVTGVRVVILSSSEYFDDAIVQICLGENNWVTVLHTNRSTTAQYLEVAILLCKGDTLN